MAIIDQLALFLVPLVLALRPLDEDAGHSATVQDHHEKSRSGSTHLLPTVIAVTPKSAFVSLSTGKANIGHREVESRKKRVSIVNVQAQAATGAIPETPEIPHIPNDWMDFLYQLIVDDGKESINLPMWQKMVKGQWAPLMWAALDKNGGKKVDEKKFKKRWEQAITAAFAKMSGDDGSISHKDVDHWMASDFEKQFAKTMLAKDGQVDKDAQMDREAFEAFIYTAMVFHCSDTDENGVVTWQDVLKNKDMNGKFGDKVAFEKEFKEGMKLSEMYEFLKKNSAFGSVGGRGLVTKIAAGVLLVTVGVPLVYLSSWKQGQETRQG